MNNTKKHIIFCSTSYFEYDRRIQRAIGLLTKNKYSITWISRSYSDNSKDLPKVNHQKIKTFFKSGVLFYLEINIRFFIKLLRIKANAICSIDNDSIIACYYASRITKKKLVFDAHEIFHEVPELINKPFKKKIWKSISRIFYPKISHKYTVNESLKNVFKDEFKSDFHVIRNVPPLLSNDHLLPETKNKTLVYLGVLNKGRGIELAINAMQELKSYNLKIIGDGDISKELKALTKKLNLETRVHFLGYLNPADISKELMRSSIGLNMLVAKSKNYKLSLANKFFDYMHAGLPSINMDYPEYKTINNESQVSVLVSKYTTKNLIEAINTIEVKTTYNSIQSNCLSASKKYNWQIESQKLIAIYNSL